MQISTCSTFIKQNIVRGYLCYMSTVAKQTPAEYCLNLVRKCDYENFLCTLLLPNTIKPAGLVIRAFNIEVAQVEDQVSNKEIGAMRMQFWKDALNKTYNGSPPHSPVTLELSRILNKHKLSKRYFKRLIDSRLERLQNSIFQNIESVEKYAEDSVSPIYYLLLEAQGIKNLHADHIASHLGKAQGIVTLIRSIPYYTNKRIVILPQDILMKHNISFETILRRQNNTALKEVVFEVATRANQHLTKAVSLKDSHESNLIFLPIKCVQNYLENLRQVDFDVFHPQFLKKNPLLPMQLYWTMIKYKIK